MTTILVAVGIFLLLAALQALLGSKRPMQRAAGGIIIGVGTLAVVNLTGFFTGVCIPVSLLSLGVSAAGGIPGVTLMLLLNLIFQ
ncbi:pro-sigmaK processing inhibitor BofA family protein [Faecalispora anaeroviscerum]|uniref:pro-sigmaK processing inhibitor BofA family protein n=1 Tax=Faecalispora anaeroviscerum TaxID=2991836 RepID=UPI0024BAC85C|nr:pro-sigmaK processing inhibitor BofA family protein [Faecalispora anaeroviscerum]